MSERDHVAYMLGLERYAYGDRDLERYARLHETARILAGREDGEGVALHAAARLSVVDRALAALLVAAVHECASVGAPVAWPRLSDEAYFAVARAQGRLADFLTFWGPFLVPESTGLADARKRHRLVGTYLQGLPEGDERAGARVAVLSLFEGTEEQAAVALAFCNNLHAADPLADAALHEGAAARLLWAAESGELARYRNEYVDLAAQVVAALGRWGVVAAHPHLERLLRHPPTNFTPVARAHLRRAVLPLGDTT